MFDDPDLLMILAVGIWLIMLLVFAWGDSQ